MQDERGEFYLRFSKGGLTALLCWCKFCFEGFSNRDMKSVCEYKLHQARNIRDIKKNRSMRVGRMFF